MRDYKTMQVSILSMLYAVNNMMRKVKGQEFLASCFVEFVDTFDDMQREVENLRLDVETKDTNLEELKLSYGVIKQDRDYWMRLRNESQEKLKVANDCLNDFWQKYPNG